MAIPLVITECKKPIRSRCSNPKLSSCANQVYDERPLLPCGTSTGSGGAGVTRKRHAMGEVAGSVHIDFNAYSVPDQMDVYLNGVLVATTGRPVGGDLGDPMPWPLDFEYDPSGDKFCVVKVTGPNGTAWTYTIGCPVP